MGVKGLWRLLLPIGRRISIETLAGQVLAVDASVWLTQFVKAMRDPETGRAVAAAHLVGLFRRLCRLRFHRIRPVLVFDGAAPEIKQREVARRRQRREQFAKLTYGSVHRLARKLLAETLLRRKKNQQAKAASSAADAAAAAAQKGKRGRGRRGAAGACVAGFIPNDAGEDEDEEEDEDLQEVEDRKPSAMEDSAAQLHTKQQLSQDEMETQAILDESLDDNHQNNSKKQQQEVSDWDLPLAVAAAEAAKEREQQEQQQQQQQQEGENQEEETIEYETFNDFSVTGESSSSPRNNHNHNNNNPNAPLFSVAHVAALPAIQRKDAIEHAKKRQRLQSRREFMPAAADPLHFSRAQVKNFLTSCRLNRDIQAMARRAALRDNHGLPGDVMASDRTTRVELIREAPHGKDGNNNHNSLAGTDDSSSDDDDDDDDDDAVGPRSLLKAKLNRSKKPAAAAAAASPTGSKRPRRLVRARASSRRDANSSVDSSDYSDEGGIPEWDGGDRSAVAAAAAAAAAMANNHSKRRKRAIDDDDSVEEVAVRAPNGHVYVRETVHLDSDDDDDDDDNDVGGGGFLPSKKSSDSKPAAQPVRKPKQKTIEIAGSSDDESEFDDSEDDDHQGGGGFVLSSKSASRPAARSRAGAPAAKTKDVIEIRASTEEEDDDDMSSDEDGAAVLPKQSAARKSPPAEATDGTVATKTTAQEAHDRALARALQEEEDAEAARKVASIADSTTGDNVAHNAAHQKHSASTEEWGTQRSQQASGEMKTDHDTKTSVSGAVAAVAESLLQDPGNSDRDDDDDDDDEVDWEDGASATHDSVEPASAFLPHRRGSSNIPGEPKNDEESSVEVLNDATADGSGDVGWEDEMLPSVSANDFDFSTKRQEHSNGVSSAMSPETSAALLQAQSTAANLTNWAGRAFRRAMAEAGASSTPTVVTNAGTPTVPQADVTMRDDSDNENDNVDNELEGVGDAAAEIVAPEAAAAAKELAQSNASPSSERSESAQKVGGGGGGGGTNDADTALPSTTQAESNRQSPAAPAPARTRQFPDSFDMLDPSVLQTNEAEWASERNRRERDMDTISDEMLEEAKQLLQLFGVPYVEAPAEAEAQCVALEELGLVSGIVTEDSDVFVFGGKTVYKNIFDEQKYAEAYAAADAEREMRLGRNGMVALAMLLGGDYTEGVKGVGIVNALEILDTFDVSEDLKEGLNGFKKWLDGFDPGDALNVKGSEKPQLKTKEQKFHAKHKSARTRWIAENFPSDAVMHAYLNPVVDKSDEEFSWGTPDMENLILFCNRHIGWPPEETRRYLEPVMKQQGGMRQTRIDSYMRYEDKIKFADVRSKRLREVLGLNKKTDGEEGDADAGEGDAGDADTT